MGRKKKYIKLSSSEKSSLKKVFNTNENHVLKKRCECILLSYEGHDIQSLAQRYNTRRYTIGDWFRRWERDGIEGLRDRPGRGRNPKLSIDNQEHVKQIKKLLIADKSSMDDIRTYIETEFGIDLSTRTVKRFVNKMKDHSLLL